METVLACVYSIRNPNSPEITAAGPDARLLARTIARTRTRRHVIGVQGGGGNRRVSDIGYTSSRKHAAMPRTRHDTVVNFCTYIYTHNMRHTRCTDIYINQYSWCWFVEWQRAKWIEQSSGVQHIDDIVFALHKSIHRHRQFMSWGRAVDIWWGGTGERQRLYMWRWNNW